MTDLRAADTAALVALLAQAPPGAHIMLDAPRYDLAQDILLDHAITLWGEDGLLPILHFIDPRHGLTMRGDGSQLQSLALTGSGHRATSLLTVAADDCVLDGVRIVGVQGSGLRADGCQRFTITDLIVKDAGQQAATFTRCDQLRLTVKARNIAHRAAAPAIHLIDCDGFSIDADIDDVNGSAITIERSEAGESACTGGIRLRASKVRRALSLLGRRDAPIEAITADVDADTWTECAMLLSNVRSVRVDLTLRSTDILPSLIFNGGFGVRDSHIDIHQPADAAALPSSPARGLDQDSGNIVTVQELATAGSEPAAWAVAPALQARLDAIGRPGFAVYEMADRCNLCGWKGLFRRTHASERETLACHDCRATLRYREQAKTLVDRLGGGRFDTLAALAASDLLPKLDIFEAGFSGPLRRWLGRARRYEQSFYEPGVPSGTRRGALTCQDLMATSFADDSFDVVITSDMFEHIRKPMLAFAEVHRILRPGGLHIWTVPIGMPPPPVTRARVDTSGPEDIMLLPPVYHGSGADSLSLVYTDFGRDINQILSAMGLPTTAIPYRGGAGHVVGVTLISTKAL